ncbi:hypothetical protein GGR56DRAFT_622024 [Xylariaceae sp. FL0804]|nr:hypothetical protein GGR56DRAFT_622024 [Xylariaceae sp. FL0804]
MYYSVLVRTEVVRTSISLKLPVLVASLLSRSRGQYFVPSVFFSRVHGYLPVILHLVGLYTVSHVDRTSRS